MTGLQRSKEMFERPRPSLAGGVSSNVRSSDAVPLFFESANGSGIYDVDGSEYIDYVLGQGPVILGHCGPALTNEVSRALERGQLYAGQHELEISLSEKPRELVPWAELVRYANSGS